MYDGVSSWALDARVTDRDAPGAQGSSRLCPVDKASFPSDILNGYYLQQPAVVRMRSWGATDQLRATNIPP